MEEAKKGKNGFQPVGGKQRSDAHHSRQEIPQIRYVPLANGNGLESRCNKEDTHVSPFDARKAICL
jgi:hypothetical protein